MRGKCINTSVCGITVECLARVSGLPHVLRVKWLSHTPTTTAQVP